MNSLVSGGSTVIEVPDETPTPLKVEQMNTVLVKIETKEHRGPVQLSIDLHDKSDYKCSIGTQKNVNMESYIWQAVEKEIKSKEENRSINMKRKMVLRPFKAFDPAQLSSKQTVLDVDKNLW